MGDKDGGGPGGGCMTDSALDEVDGAEDAGEVTPMPPGVDVVAESGGDASVGGSVVEALGRGAAPVPPWGTGAASTGVGRMTDGVEATGWVVDTGADSVAGRGGGVCMGGSVVAVGARPGDGAIGESGFDPLSEGCPPPDPPDPPGAWLDPEPPVPFGMTLTLPIKDFAGYSSPRPAARAAGRLARCPCSTRPGATRYYRALTRLEPAWTSRRPGTRYPRVESGTRRRADPFDPCRLEESLCGEESSCA